MLEYFADLYDLTGDEKYKKYAKRTADKLISDSYEEKKGRSFYFDIGRNQMQRRSSSTPQTLPLDHVLDGRRISL